MAGEITAAQLAELQDSGEEFVLVDTRPRDSFDAWHVSGAHNLPYSPDDDLSARDLDALEPSLDGKRIVTICAKGISSGAFAEELDDMGYDVEVVRGGMEAWSQVYEHVPVPSDGEAEFIQIQRRAKGCLGYVVGSQSEGVAAAVDVTRNTGEFEAAARTAGYEITRVLDTHVHADHISGGRALADDLGVPYHLGTPARERGVEYEYEPLGRNEVVSVGGLDIKAVYTPGHTSELVSYLVGDEAVLTGDALFVESIGRTELEFGDADAARGARLQYDSLHKTLMAEPDSVTVLPGHVTVTNDGEYRHGSPGQPIVSDVGSLRRGLDVLQLDEEAFVTYVTEHVPEKPPNYETLVDVNRGKHEMPDEEEATELELGPNRCAAP